MSVDPHVLARARARVRGPVPQDPAEPAPPGTLLAADGSRVWPLPAWPDGATPALLEEYETAPMPLDRPGQARRVLAAALRCCWTEVDAAPWPGRASTIADVLEVYAQMGRGDLDLARRWALGELRRLADSGWLLLDEPTGTLRLGPRTATWPDEALGTLRDLIRRLPEPPTPAKAPDTTTQGPTASECASVAESAITSKPASAAEDADTAKDADTTTDGANTTAGGATGEGVDGVEVAGE